LAGSLSFPSLTLEMYSGYKRKCLKHKFFENRWSQVVITLKFLLEASYQNKNIPESGAKIRIIGAISNVRGKYNRSSNSKHKQ
jgi:hypothetical protein